MVAFHGDDIILAVYLNTIITEGAEIHTHAKQTNLLVVTVIWNDAVHYSETCMYKHSYFSLVCLSTTQVY
jgi:hypothetical protein